MSVMQCVSCLVFCLATMAAEAAMFPAPVDIPAGPPAVNAPGGRNMPAMGGAGGQHAPQISGISETTFPDETLAIAGKDLKDATFRIWAEGMVFDGQVLRSRDDIAQVVVPAQIEKPVAGTPGATPLSCMLVWPLRGDTCGTPIRVNGATAWWMWPCRKVSDDPDRTIRVFGKNLCLSHATPVIVIQRENDPPQTLSVMRKSSEELVAELPSNMGAGKCQVWAHNGTGGCYGWSRAVVFEIVKNPYRPTVTVHVDKMPGANDMEKIKAAIRSAAANPAGGIVQFSAREYALTAPIHVPESGTAPIVMKGAGAAPYDAKAGRFSGRGTVLVNKNPELNDHLLRLNSPGSSLKDLSMFSYFAGPGHPPKEGRGQGFSVRTKDIVVDNVVSVAWGSAMNSWFDRDRSGAVNLEVRNCVFYAHDALVNLHAPNSDNFIRFSNCKFRGIWSNGSGTDSNGLSIRGASRVIVEDCEFESVDALAGMALNRAIAVFDDQSHHHYFVRNRTRWMGAFKTVPGRDTNTGEQFLYHGNGQFREILETREVTADSITVAMPKNKLPQNFGKNNDDSVYIGLGAGAGQWRVVTGFSTEGGSLRLTLDRPWRVLPVAGGRASVGRHFYECALCENDADPVPEPSKITLDFNRSGIQPWEAHFDFVCARNTFKHVRAGFFVNFSYGVISAWSTFRDNLIEDCDDGGPYNQKGVFFWEATGIKPNYLDTNFCYTIGNTYRRNMGRRATQAVFLGTEGNGPTVPGTGVVSSIFEHNAMLDTAEPIVVKGFVDWPLLRNNKLSHQQPLLVLQPTRVNEPLTK